MAVELISEIVVAFADFSCRNAGHDCKWLYIFSHHCTSCDNGSLADIYRMKYRSSGAYPGSVADCHLESVTAVTGEVRIAMIMLFGPDMHIA